MEEELHVRVSEEGGGGAGVDSEAELTRGNVPSREDREGLDDPETRDCVLGEVEEEVDVVKCSIEVSEHEEEDLTEVELEGG